jgi:hypothetical protein
MRGDSQATSARLPAVVPNRRWSARLSEVGDSLRQARGERLELIERLASEKRRARQAGEYAADLGYRPRWF